VEIVDRSKQNHEKKAVLGIFAKQPLPGRVKTRLCPPLSFAEAAELYRNALFETVTRMSALRNCELVVFFSGERGWFADSFPDLSLQEQQGGDLGERMAFALNALFLQGYQRAVLIGSDAPDVPLTFIERALEQLLAKDLVVGPAVDGGYYLIGESGHHPELFEDIPWSTERVLVETLRRAERLNLSFEQLETWEDLDDIEALRCFLERTSSGATVDYLRRRLVHHFPR
jgi:rSAM/selenodomain-associated transferase 1